jgi:hypothetical protein
VEESEGDELCKNRFLAGDNYDTKLQQSGLAIIISHISDVISEAICLTLDIVFDLGDDCDDHAVAWADDVKRVCGSCL